MAKLPSAFRHEDVKGDEPLPAGIYLCEITKSNVVPTKAGNGHRMVLTIKIIDCEYEGSVIFESLNIDNPNPRAVKIAQERLKSLCQVCDIDELEDTAELHGIPFTAKVQIKPATDGWEARNEVTSYHSPEVAENEL